MNQGMMNPYVGLRPFEEEESILFFGRNEQVMELLQRLHQHHFIAVVGSSGSGKSSLIRAGLIPALKAGYLVEDCDHWDIVIMKPGKNPVYNLAASLLESCDAGNDIAAFSKKIKEEGADAVLQQLALRGKGAKSNTFLLIDQFEELFRFDNDQCDRKDEAIDFVNIFLELAAQKEIPCYVVITMRSDFIGDCARFYGLPEAMNRSQYLVPKLNRQQLKMAIEGPAKLSGGNFHPVLTSRLINELRNIKDELPLLQHALMRTWDYEMTTDKSGEINLNDYESIGGLENALSMHADEALKELDEKDQDIVKTAFQALTAIDENGRKIRRPVSLGHLAKLTGATEEHLLNLLKLFIKDRRNFLVISASSEGSDKIIDISHESLIRQWNTLSGWVDEENEMASGFLQLAKSTALNQSGKKDFLGGSELNVASAWYQKFKPTEARAKRYAEDPEQVFSYLRASEKDRSRKKMQRKIWIAAVVGILIFAFFMIQNVRRLDRAQVEKKARYNLLMEKRNAAIANESRLLALVYTSELLLLADEQVSDSIMKVISDKNDLKNYILPKYILDSYLQYNDEVYYASLSADGSVLTTGLKNGAFEKRGMFSGQKELVKYDNATTSNMPDDGIPDSLVGNISFHYKNPSENQKNTTLHDSAFYYKRQFIELIQRLDPTAIDGAGIWLIDRAIWFSKGAAVSGDKKSYLTWEDNKYTWSSIRPWSDKGVPIDISLIHRDIKAAAFAGGEKNHIVSWGADSVVRVWKYTNTDFDKTMPPKLFRLKVFVETGVKMNEKDYSLDIISKKEYDLLKAQYARELGKFLKRTK